MNKGECTVNGGVVGTVVTTSGGWGGGPPIFISYGGISTIISPREPSIFGGGGGGGYQHPVDRIINNSRGKDNPKPVQPLPDPCGKTTDIGASFSVYNFGLQIGRHALYFYGGAGAGVPRFAGNITTSNSSPSEGNFIVGNAGVAIGGTRSVQANTLQQGVGEFFNRNSNNATASYGAMTPQLNLSYQRNVRIYNFGAGDRACQK